MNDDGNMRTDFLDAHRRHMADARTLEAALRWANADHLYGVAAECGLKCLMTAFGMRLAPAGHRPHHSVDRVHADRAWGRYEAYRSGSPAGAMFPLPAQNPFDDWSIDQRYAHQSEFDATRVARHHAGARAVLTLVDRAERAGLI